MVDYNGLEAWTALIWWRINNTTAIPAESVVESITGEDVESVTVPDAGSISTVSSPTGVVVQAVGNVRVRSASSINSERVAGLGWGDTVAAIGRTSDNGWIQVQVGSVQGWVSSAWLRLVTGSYSSLEVK